MNYLGFEFGTPEHREAIHLLRKACVEYIHRHENEFHFIIMNEICEMKQLSMQDIEPERQRTLVNEYTSDILVNNNWCGSEMIVSVVQLYRINITIYSVDAPPMVFEAPEGGAFNINLLYSGYPVKNHYDVIVDISDGTNEGIRLEWPTDGKTREEPSASDLLLPNETKPSEAIGTTRSTALSPSGSSVQRETNIINAMLSCLMKSDPTVWEFQINALNLKKATLKEIRLGLCKYAGELQMTTNELDDLLTHWEVTDDFGEEIISAAANVLHTDIYLYDATETRSFKGSGNNAQRVIGIERCSDGFIPRLTTWDGGKVADCAVSMNQQDRKLSR